jgi:hypothetical protein
MHIKGEIRELSVRNRDRSGISYPERMNTPFVQYVLVDGCVLRKSVGDGFTGSRIGYSQPKSAFEIESIVVITVRDRKPS